MIFSFGSAYPIIALRRGMSIEELNSAQQQIDSLSGRLFAVAEGYPELRSSEVFAELQRGIRDAEEHLQAARRLYIILGVLVLMLLSVVVLVMIVVRQNRHLHNLNRRMKTVNRSLHEANNIKERYISLYLAVYADSLRRMAKMAPKATGQTSAQFMEAEMPAFYHHFDTSFLSIYPDFVEEFNALLRPEERIYPEKEGTLNTELRIFALIRLGIDSGARIAELLCYSANTIYNYRARVKNHALSDRDGFEDRVRKIGTFTE